MYIYEREKKIPLNNMKKIRVYIYECEKCGFIKHSETDLGDIVCPSCKGNEEHVTWQEEIDTMDDAGD